MSADLWERLCLGGLAFYGKTTASSTHEIKNQLSIIKEQAGLIGDLVAMARQGRPLDLDRIEDLGRRIDARVRQADESVKELNRFAHSVDRPYGPVDVGETLASTVALSRRYASAKRVELEVRSSEAGLSITTRPYFLRQAMAACLEAVVETAGEGKLVWASASSAGDGVRCLFGCESAGAPPEFSDGELIAPLLALLGAEVRPDAGAAGLALHLPWRLEPNADGDR